MFEPANTSSQLPRSDSPEAARLIEEVMAERNYPSSPQAAARAGYEACFRMSERNRQMVQIVQSESPPSA